MGISQAETIPPQAAPPVPLSRVGTRTPEIIGSRLYFPSIPEPNREYTHLTPLPSRHTIFGSSGIPLCRIPFVAFFLLALLFYLPRCCWLTPCWPRSIRPIPLAT